MSIIKVTNLTKSFKLPHEKHSTLKSSIINFKSKNYETLTVLDDISFEIKKGEFFGVVGRNGGGKSTLLKLIAGIYQPTNGGIEVDGSLTPFIELGVGFNPELSGRDNIFLNGALLGLTKTQIEEVYDEIVEFSELEKFMDQKIKNYSSGMQVRLAFSIAIQANTDILLIDEVLAVGDASFQTKCYNYFHELKKNKKTVVFISHDMNAVQMFCERAIIIDRGKITHSGNPKDIAREYSLVNLQQSEKSLNKPNEANEGENEKSNTMRWGNGMAEIIDVYTLNNNKKSSSFMPGQDIEIVVEFSAKEDLASSAMGINFTDASGKIYFATNTDELEFKMPKIKAGEKFKGIYKIDNVYTDGEYSISTAISTKVNSEPYARVEDVHSFQIGGRSIRQALVHPKHNFELKKDK